MVDMIETQLLAILLTNIALFPAGFHGAAALAVIGISFNTCKRECHGK